MIELLIVIAVLGTLITVVVVALNPIQRLASTRDAGRLNTTTQLGRALDAYGVNNSGSYVAEAGTGCTPANWIGCLVTSADITSVPSQVTNTLTAYCALNAVNGYCYDATSGTGGAPAIVYSRLEGTSNISRCTTQFGATYVRAYAIYSTSMGRGGIACTTAADPTVAGHATGTDWLP